MKSPENVVACLLLAATRHPFDLLDADHFYWEFLLGAEVADLCAQSPDAYTTFPGIDSKVQRAWSNKAAAAGHDPCVPELPGEVYFNSVPVLNDDVVVPALGGLSMKGVTIPVGQTKTIDIDLFSDAPLSGWNVQAFDGATFTGGSNNLSLSLDKIKGANGDVLHLTIKVLKKGMYGFETFVLYSTRGKQSTIWAGLVGN